MAFGIQDLEQDVQKFRQDIENAKAKYMNEYAEYLNITTELENVAQKYEFLQEDVKPVTRVFSEEREESDNTLSDVTIGFLSSAAAFEVIAGITYMVAKHQLWQLSRNPTTVEVLQRLAAQGGSRNAVRLTTSLTSGNPVDTIAIRSSRAAKASKIAKFTAGAGAVLAIVGIALAIADVIKRREYLEEQKAELQGHLDEFNGYIAETNDDTKNVINAFLTYFDEFGIDVNGVFNDNQDGFLGESGRQKFDDPENGVAAQLREASNGAIRRMGELNASINVSKNVMNFFLGQGLEGAGLIEQVANFTGLPVEVIQRLYVFKLRELGYVVQKAIELSELPQDLVKKLYARAYIDDGKTVEETVELSGLTEDQVRRVYASKLLDDELNAENPDGLDIEGIAEQAGVSKEIVLEVQVRKTAAAFPNSSEEES